MKTIGKLFLFIFIFGIIMQAQTINLTSLMPVPASIEETGSKHILDTTFTISVLQNGEERLNAEATRFLRRLSGRTGMFFTQVNVIQEDIDPEATMTLNPESIGELKVDENESYKLTITEDKITVEAKTDMGARHALETVLQLLTADEGGYFFPTCVIEDYPRFAWRGLMLDVCRHWMPIEVVKRNIDGMAAVKMNVLHLHLSEDQGFRVECKAFPKLHEMGSDGNYFTHEQIKEILAYAAQRGIRVMPEFDVPGHATSWFVGYPEYASAMGPYKIERSWGIFDPTFDPTLEKTYEFFDAVFGEMAALFPDEYFHIGGDENNGKQWDANEQIQKFMKKNNIPDNHALQAYFNNRILKILTAHDKKMVGWDEILHDEMPNNIVIQSWRGTESLVKAAKKGYMGILSNGYYIDLMQPASDHYLNDPIPAGTTLTAEEQARILGGEATMWAELITPETIDSRIWPRTAAIAERFWSQQNVNDVHDMYIRLEDISYQLEEHGLTHIKNQDMLLRRIAGNTGTEALKTLIRVCEPLKLYKRHRQGVKYQQHSPYTRFVDAATADAEDARKFRYMTEKFIETKDEAFAVIMKSMLQTWINNHHLIEEQAKQSPMVKELVPLSKALKELSQLGLELVDNVQNGTPMTIKNTEEILENAKKSYGQVEMQIVSAIEKLLEAGK